MIGTYDYKVVNAYPVKDGNAQTVTTDIISLKNYDHITFIWTFGVVNASSATSTNYIAYKGEDFTTCTTAFAIKGYRAEVTAAGDTLEALTACTTTGVSAGTGNTLDITGDNAIIVFEIDAEDLEPTIANPYDTVCMSAVWSAHSIILGCIAILSKGRFKNKVMPTAIA